MKQNIFIIGEIHASLYTIPKTSGKLFSCSADSACLLAAAIIQKLGLHAYPVGIIKSDEMGKAIWSDLWMAGIDTTFLTTCAGETLLNFVSDSGMIMQRYAEECYPGKNALPLDRLEKGDVVLFYLSSPWDQKTSALYQQLIKACRQSEALFILASCVPIKPDEWMQQDSPDLLCVTQDPMDFEEYPHNIFSYLSSGLQMNTDAGIKQLKISADSKNFTAAVAFLVYLFSISFSSRKFTDFLDSPKLLEKINKFLASAGYSFFSFDEFIQSQAVSKKAPPSHANMLMLAQHAMDEAALRASQDPHRPIYHIASPSGWINDPNGLIQMNGIYHVFFQLHPFSPEWGPMYWGHVTSPDLVHWNPQPIALAPDQPYEAGCFSGSAVNDNGTLTLIYTAHDDSNSVKEVQCIARSFDGGRTFQKEKNNPVIPCYPSDSSPDFRDPKVWKEDDLWHLVVGSQRRKKGQALLYTSSDLVNWDYRGIMCESDGTQGSMWECPNFCRVDGQDLLIVSPMGMKGHKNIYLSGNFDCKKGIFQSTYLREIDFGESFYASQVFEDESGRVILIAWMDAWGKDYPTQAYGWAGILTLPRVLHMRGTTLLQQPPKELENLRKSHIFSGGFTLEQSINPLSDISGECIEFFFLIDRTSIHDILSIGLRISKKDLRRTELLYDSKQNAFALYYGKSHGKKSKVNWIPCECSQKMIDVRIYIDRSSIEIFIDEGALCITSRIYPSPDCTLYDVIGNDGVKFPVFDAWLLNDISF